ncbi:MAG: MoaD/ThiS family protein [Candidatus Thermoplasmatota archaeon]|nr:MoaD/ThiS family protein [Candidatus Thermoplasmatota archaeon]
MKVTITFSRLKKSQDIEISPGSTISDVLKKLNLKPDALIVMNNDTPLPIDHEVTKNQHLTIIQVASGG